MGLAMVHGIVTSHGGAIMVQSTPGKGTTFQIYLPCIETAVDGETPAEEPLPYGNGSILFVDDEQSLAQVGQRLLEQLGYDVVVKTNSLEALGIFRIDPYRFDLVITDQTMPYVTGAVLADKFRHIRPDIPIILCTGFSHTIDAAKAKTQGIDAFLMKPLMLRDLGRTIQKVLAQRPHGPATPEC
jgi:CheY-like chemotaxis protein